MLSLYRKKLWNDEGTAVRVAASLYSMDGDVREWLMWIGRAVFQHVPVCFNKYIATARWAASTLPAVSILSYFFPLPLRLHLFSSYFSFPSHLFPAVIFFPFTQVAGLRPFLSVKRKEQRLFHARQEANSKLQAYPDGRRSCGHLERGR